MSGSMVSVVGPGGVTAAHIFTRTPYSFSFGGTPPPVPGTRRGNWVLTAAGVWRWHPTTLPAIWRPPLLLNATINPTYENTPGAASQNAWLVADLAQHNIPDTARFVHLRGFFIGGVAPNGPSSMIHVDVTYANVNTAAEVPVDATYWPGQEGGENALQGALYAAVSLVNQQIRDVWTLYAPVSIRPSTGAPIVWFRWRVVPQATVNPLGYWLGVDAYEE